MCLCLRCREPECLSYPQPSAWTPTIAMVKPSGSGAPGLFIRHRQGIELRRQEATLPTLPVSHGEPERFTSETPWPLDGLRSRMIGCVACVIYIGTILTILALYLTGLLAITLIESFCGLCWTIRTAVGRVHTSFTAAHTPVVGGLGDRLKRLSPNKFISRSKITGLTSNSTETGHSSR